MTEWTVDLLQLKKEDAVLEIGFGSGNGIDALLSMGIQNIAGLDLSKDMVKKASQKYKQQIAEGTVCLYKGNADRMDFVDNTFSAVFAVNVLYFWKEPVATLTEIQRIMKSGGTVALSIGSKKDALNNPFAAEEDIFIRYSEAEDVYPLFKKAGFTNIRHDTMKDVMGTYYCILADKA